MKFRVVVGIHVPVLRSMGKFIEQGDFAGLHISHSLGQFRNTDCTAPETWYGFRTSEQLKQAIEKMHGDFLNQAVPWLGQFQGLADVATYFYKKRIEDTSKSIRSYGVSPPDPFAWAIYGWMLEELGKREEAISWWQKAYEEVHRPLFVDKSGRSVLEGTKGAKLVRHPDAEERLEELLRQSLGLPTT